MLLEPHTAPQTGQAAAEQYFKKRTLTYRKQPERAGGDRGGRRSPEGERGPRRVGGGDTGGVTAFSRQGKEEHEKKREEKEIFRKCQPICGHCVCL